MDENGAALDPRAQTLSTLDAFIASQRALLARTQEDIERLRRLKGEVVRDSEQFFDQVDEKLDSPSFRLSNAGDAFNLTFEQKIRWEAFSGRDPAPLLTVTSSLAASLPPRSPLKTQSSPLSRLQLLVKSARKSIIDPVLIKFPPPLPFDDDDPDDMGGPIMSAEEVKRNKEHEKIRELKRMVKAGGKGYTRGGGLSLPKQAVFVREDVEDENVIEVDVDMDAGAGEGEDATPTPTTMSSASKPKVKEEWVEPEPMDVLEPVPPPASLPKPAPKPKAAPPARTSTRRSARAAAPSMTPTASTSSARPNKRAKIKHEDDDEFNPHRASSSYGGKTAPLSSSSSTPPPYQHRHGHSGKSIEAVSRIVSSSSTRSASPSRGSLGGKSLESLGVSASSTGGKSIPTPAPATKKGKKDKPKPETYKQAWSVEEQHLLEQLLEEIPEGVGFRWQKISRAMGGKRTPRQVASRVQKYFEKLRRFGVG